MLAKFVLFLSLASAMSAPTMPTNEALQAPLIATTPNTLKDSNQLLDAQKAMSSSLAAAAPDLSQVLSLAAANQPANLNLAGGLGNILNGLVSSVLNRLLPGASSSQQPAPTNPAGTDIFGPAPGVETGPGFGSGIGSGMPANGAGIPQAPAPAPAPAPSRPNIFNPFGSLFSGGGNPFSMFFSPMMFSNMLEGFMEFF